jgi:hypothetical protein
MPPAKRFSPRRQKKIAIVKTVSQPVENCKRAFFVERSPELGNVGLARV